MFIFANYLKFRASMYYKILIPIIFLFVLSSCGNKDNTENKYIENSYGYRAIIEISAGTNHKIELNKTTNTFECDIIDGKDRIIDFLPYPANYGFISNTLMDTSMGGDGDPLDIFLISESVPTASEIDFIPLGIIYMYDENEADYKILAVPRDSTKQIIKAKNFNQLQTDYPKIIEILKIWLTEYKHTSDVRIDSIGNEIAAEKEINKWRIE